MPILSLQNSDPRVDGRQSDRALTIRAGVARYFEEAGHAVLSELSLKGGRRADLVCLCPKGRVTIVEIKSSRADFEADHKWADYLDHCDAFYFATLADVPADIFPASHGFIIADQYFCDVVRESAPNRLSAQRRKDVLLRCARQVALRLRRLELLGYGDDSRQGDGHVCGVEAAD
ncbi:MAG: MmcB family DNA repair protein [Pseudomonadota bacterium]